MVIDSNQFQTFSSNANANQFQFQESFKISALTQNGNHASSGLEDALDQQYQPAQLYSQQGGYSSVVNQDPQTSKSEILQKRLLNLQASKSKSPRNSYRPNASLEDPRSYLNPPLTPKDKNLFNQIPLSFEQPQKVVTKTRSSWKAHEGPINQLLLIDNDKVATCSADTKVKIWDK